MMCQPEPGPEGDEHAPRPRLAQLHREPLAPDDMLLALPREHRALTRDGPVALAALHDESWATARAGTAYADMCIRLCRSHGGFEPDVRHRTNDMRLLLDLVARGCAAIVPALGRPDRDDRIAVRPIAEGSFSRAIFAAVRTSDRARPSTAAVLEAVSPAEGRTARRAGSRSRSPRR